MDASREMSRHHWYAVIQAAIEANMAGVPILYWVQVTVDVVMAIKANAATIGQGLMFTMWNL